MGYWSKNDDGTVSTDHGTFESEHLAAMDAEKREKGGAFGGAAMSGPMGFLITAFMFLVVFGPIVLAKAYGFLFGVLSHAGKGGRVAQAFVFQFLPIGLMTMAGSFSAIKNLIGDFSVTAIIGVVIAGVLNLLCLGMAFWFYHSYYFTVAAMGISVFSEMIKKAAMIVWFSCLGGGLITMANPVVGGVIIAAGFVAAIIYFIKLSKEHSTNAKEMKGQEPASPTSTLVLMIITLVLNAGIPAVLGVPAGIEYAVQVGQSKARDAANKQLEERVVDAAKKAATQNVIVITKTTSYITSVAKHYTYSSVDVLATVNGGESLTLTGQAVKTDGSNYVPVKYKNTTGFVDAKSVLTVEDYNALANKFVVGKTVTVNSYTSLNNQSGTYAIKSLPKGSVLTITGKLDGNYLPVEFEGENGYVNVIYVDVK